LDPDEYDVRYLKAPDFAEVAEALGITTINVMGVASQEAALYVVYTRDVEEVGTVDELYNQQVYTQRLVRQPDGIMVKAGEEHNAGTLADKGRGRQLIDMFSDILHEFVKKRDES